MRDINPNDEKDRQRKTSWSTVVRVVRGGE